MGTRGLALPPLGRQGHRVVTRRLDSNVCVFPPCLTVHEAAAEENAAARQLSQEAPGKSANESVRRAKTLENTTPSTEALSQQKWEWEGDAADGSKVGQINQSHETLANSAALAGMCDFPEVIF